MNGAPHVAVAGCGRWGRHLVRTMHGLGALRAVVDTDPSAASAMAAQYEVPALSLDAALDEPAVRSVVVAVPAAAHAEVARRALEAGKHVLVEKPLALCLADGEALCALAQERSRVLMVGHLLRYHPAFRALQGLVQRGALGRLQYLASNRLNLGRFRPHEDTLWSFAPHDISMILALVGAEPVSVTATGGSFLTEGVADVTTTHLGFASGERAQIFVSWLHPLKEQRLVVVGTDGMAVFDDGQPWGSKLRLFPEAVVWRDGLPEAAGAEARPVLVEADEPLTVECQQFLESVETGTPPPTDGAEGVRVLRVLEAARRCLDGELGRPAWPERPGRPAWPERPSGPTAVDTPAHPGVFVHPSAYVDEPCEIGEGTRIWHFSHVQPGARIGANCTLGQNVMIGPGVVVGHGCKIQNNVSVYQGVTLDDGVFCGPSCVFTNVNTPRAGVDRRGEFRPTRVGAGATIGANATVVCGHDIGPWAFVAAGAVVTSDVPAHALVAGVPARRIGWVSHAGERLGDDLVCPRTGRRYALTGPDRLEELAPLGRLGAIR